MSSISEQTVREISNDGIRKELLNNFDKNAVFRVYRRSLLYEVEKVLQRNEIGSDEEVKATDILLTIDMPDVDEHIKNLSELYLLGVSGKDLEIRRAFWNHLVAIIFMKQLKEKYPVESEHLDLLDEEESYFTEKSFKEYLEVESQLISREDIFKTIEDLNLEKPIRLHIVVKTEPYGLNDEISYYLQNEYSFTTMVYSETGNFGIIITRDEKRYHHTETRLFKYFDRGELKEDNYPKRAKRKK